jgi:hypothetical protein
MDVCRELDFFVQKSSGGRGGSLSLLEIVAVNAVTNHLVDRVMDTDEIMR